VQTASPKQVAIVCNGELDHGQETKKRIASFPLLVAVNGGTKHCQQLGLKPHLIIGDLDSCSPDTLEHFSEVPCKKFPIDKDKTDLELALDELMKPDVQEITIFGALGKRIDHSLTNILLLSRFPGRLFIESKEERLFVIDREFTLSCELGQTLSLIPLNGPVSGIQTRGLKWNLTDAVLDKNFIGVSNQAVEDEVWVSVGHGDLLCCFQG
jgi:thiamine pyrophosphokinase